jgi:choice-of-anchor B domain-containing protein
MNRSLLLAYFLLLAIPFSHAQQSLDMNLLGNWDDNTLANNGNQYNDIWGYVDCQGNEYALMGSREYIHIFDVTNPANPVELDRFADNSQDNTTWRDLKTFQTYAYTVCDNCNEGMQVFDLSALPGGDVVKVADITNPFTRAHNLYIEQNTGYLYAVGTNAGGNRLVVFDVGANPANPPLVANVPMPGGYAHDLFVKGSTAYCFHGTNGLYVYDVSNPNNLQVLGTLDGYPQEGYNHSGWLNQSGTHLVFADETHDKSVKIADVTDLTDITVTDLFRSTLLAPAHTASIVHNQLILGDYLFCSYYHDGVQVYDISNPNDVVNVAYYDTYPANTNYNGFQGCWGVYPFLPSGNIIASDMSNGLFVLELTDISLPAVGYPTAPSVSISAGGPTEFCDGESVTLTVSGSAQNYQWYRDNTPVGSNSNTYTANQSGEYYVIASNSYCETTSNSITVTEYPFPSVEITADEFEACDGEVIVLTASGQADTYQWYRNGNPISGANNIIYLATLPGNYTVETTLEICSDFSDPVTLNFVEYPDPMVDFTGLEACIGESLTFTATPDAETYQWFMNGAPLPNETSQTLEVFTSGDYFVEVSNGDCTETSITLPAQILPLPSGEIDLPSGQGCDGDTITLSLNGNYDFFTWYKNGVPVPPPYTDQLEVTEAGTYWAELSLATCDGVTDEVTVTFDEIPTVTTTFSSLEGCQGDVLELNVNTSASSIQWFENGLPLAGANAPTLEVTNSGNYFAEVANGNCLAFSDTLNTVIYDFPTVTITSPTTGTCQGNIIELEAFGVYESLQWTLNGSPISGANTSVYEAGITGTYQAIATNGGICDSPSPSINLQFSPEPDTTLTFLQNEGCVGDELSISVPSGAANYQWQQNGTPIAGATDPTYLITESGSYSVEVANGACMLTTSEQPAFFYSIPDLDLSYDETEACEGTELPLVASGNYPSLQWTLNGSDIPGATGDTLIPTQTGTYQAIALNGICTTESEEVEIVLDPLADNTVSFNTLEACEDETITLGANGNAQTYAWFLDGNTIPGATEPLYEPQASGTYEVILTNGICSVTSDPLEIVVTPLPTIEMQYDELTACAGNPILLSASGSYQELQWYLNGNPIPGASDNELEVMEAGNYQIIVANDDCQAVSEEVTVSFTPFPNSDVSFNTLEGCEGDPITLTATPGAESYQWLNDGAPIPGATEETFEPTESGTYSLEVANQDCAIESDPLEVTITAFPTVSVDAPGEGVCEGEVIEISASGTYQTLQWLLDGVPVPGANDPVYQANQSGLVELLASNGNCTVLIEVGPLAFDPEPNNGLIFETLTTCAGTPIVLNAADPDTDYQWLLDGQPINGATEQSLSLLEAGTYSVQLTNGFCTAVSEEVVVTVEPLPELEVEADQPFTCAGQTIALEAMGNFDQISWSLNGTPIPGANNSNLEASETGVYEALAILGNCPQVESIELEFLPIPSPLIEADALEACEGETLLLSSADSSLTYQWFLNGMPIENANGAQLEASEPGFYTLYQSNGDCDNISEGINLQFNPLPNVELSAEINEACEGDPILLSASGQFDQVQWLQDGNPIPGAEEPTLEALTSGTYTVSVLLGACEGTSAAEELTFIPYPDTILSFTSTTGCAGDTILLSADPDADTYQWHVNDQPLVNSIEPTLEVIESGLYSVNMSNGNCAIFSQEVEITLFDPVIPVIDVSMDSVLSTGPAAEYLWYLNGTSIPGATSDTFIANESGTYTVVTVDENGCTGISEPVVIELISSIADVELGETLNFRLAPNPTTDQTQLLFEEPTSTSLFFRLYSSQGQDLQTATIPMGAELFVIQVQDLPRGTYLIQLIGDGRITTRKLIVQ